jgi:hypothetical protein
MAKNKKPLKAVKAKPPIMAMNQTIDPSSTSAIYAELTKNQTPPPVQATPLNQPPVNEQGQVQISISIEELRKRSIFLATPMYGGNCGGMYARSVADLSAACIHYGIKLQMYFLFNESLITRARNYCCDEFMRSDCTHMLFIDSDIGFNPQDVIAMLAMSSPDSPYDIIGAPYPKKCISWEKIKKAVDKGFGEENPNDLEKFVGDYVFNPKAGTNAIPIHQPVEVMEIGTGFMMFPRKTLETFQQKMPHLSYKPDHVRTEHFDGTREIMSYFDCIVERGYEFNDLKVILKEAVEGKKSLEEVQAAAMELFEREAKASKRYLSEDYKFCYDAAKIGLKIWLCPWMRTQHVGTYVFGGALADLAALGAAATADIEELNKIKAVEKARRTA